MGDNPFSAMMNGGYSAALDPSQSGTLMGFVGGMLGSPTKSDAAGSATGRALQELSALRDQGMTPQQSLLKWFQTPSGQDYFSNAGPDGLKQLTAGLQATMAPAPTMNNIPPGGMLTATDQNGKTTTAASNPQQFPNQVLGPGDIQVNGQGQKLGENENVKGDEPADVKSFKFFTQLAKLPPAEIKRLAALKADPSPNDPNSVKAQAIDKMVRDGLITDPQLALALKADTITILPLKNDVGQDTGAITVYDKSNPAAGAQVINPGSRGPAATQGSPQNPLPGTTPGTGAGAGTLPPAPVEPAPAKPQNIPESNPAYFGNKSSMFLGSGAVAKALGAATSATEQLNPKAIIPEGSLANDRQTMIDTLRSDLAAMGQLGGGIGVNKGVLEGYLKLAPSGGLTQSPHEAIQKAIRLHEHIQQEVQAEEEKFSNAKLPLEERKQSVARAEGWKRVLRDLPTYDELGKMEKAIREGTAGAPTVAGGVKTLIEAGGKALTEGKKQAQEVQGATSTPSVNIDNINDPKELLAIDPRTLDRGNKIKYIRKLEAITKQRPAR